MHDNWLFLCILSRIQSFQNTPCRQILAQFEVVCSIFGEILECFSKVFFFSWNISLTDCNFAVENKTGTGTLTGTAKQ
jgi:hypothetical protein